MPRKEKKIAAKKEKFKPTTIWPLYLLLVLLIVGYSLQNNILLGIAAFIVVIIILVIIVREVKEEVQVKGKREGVKEILMAIGAAVCIWILLIIILQTTSPINAVASCSMLPILQKGDLIVLHGIGNFSQFTNSISVPVVNVTDQQFTNMQSNMNNEFLAFYAYFNGNGSKISEVIPHGSNFTYSVALYNTQCISRYEYLNQPQNLYKCYVGANPSSNLIKYNYSLGTLSISGANYTIVQTSSIQIANTTINENFSNPIIVYATTSRDVFGGSIIHRLVAIISVNGTYYTLTRGDNNPALDIEFGNYPSRQSEVIGHVLTSIPLLGYFKLIISGQIGTTPGCDQIILR